MIFKILTKGWLLRSFIVSLWLIALIFRCFELDDKILLIPLFIGAANGFLYLTVALRLTMLTHSSMSRVLPNYFSQLKKSLLIILGMSLIPALMLLPNIALFLSLLSVLIIMAMFLVTITYQSKLYFMILPLCFMPILLEGNLHYLSFLSDIAFSLILASLLPIIAWWSYRLLSRLETYKGDVKQRERIIALMGLNTKATVASLEKVPLKSQNKLVQWVVNNNFEYYRRLIRSEKSMTNTQQLALACQGNSTVGRTTYLLWGVIALLFSWGGRYLENEYQDIIVVIVIMFPAIIFGLGTIGFFQVINSKKSLLKRLSIMPCFNDKQHFSWTFITYVLSEQLKLYLFVSLIVAMFTYSFEYLTVTMYMNVLLIVLILCLFKLTLMFLAWSSKHPNYSVVIWLMIIALIGAYISLIVVADNNILLWLNTTFIALILIVIGLFSMSLYRGYRQIPQGV